MAGRIIRGVRVATPRGIEPASVFIEDGRIAYVAGYEDIPRQANAEELGKSLLMPGLILPCGAENADKALFSGVTTTTTGAKEIPSELPLYLSKTWTAMRERDERLEALVENLCSKPALHVGLHERKGSIAVGFDADLVVWNPEYTVTGTDPLLFGLIRQVIVAGETVIKEGKRI